VFELGEHLAELNRRFLFCAQQCGPCALVLDKTVVDEFLQPLQDLQGRAAGELTNLDVIEPKDFGAAPGLYVDIGGLLRFALDQPEPIRFQVAIHGVGDFAGFESSTILGHRHAGRMLDDDAFIELGKLQRYAPHELPMAVSLGQIFGHGLPNVGRFVGRSPWALSSKISILSVNCLWTHDFCVSNLAYVGCASFSCLRRDMLAQPETSVLLHSRE
jgi:hypothetical protein